MFCVNHDAASVFSVLAAYTAVIELLIRRLQVSVNSAFEKKKEEKETILFRQICYLAIQSREEREFVVIRMLTYF